MAERARRDSTAQQTAHSVAREREATRAEVESPAAPSSLSSPALRRSPRLQEASPHEEARPVMHRAVRQTGLEELFGAALKDEGSAIAKRNQRKLPKKCTTGAWQYAEIVEENGKLTATCSFCSFGPFRVASQTRLIDHLLGRGGIRSCSADSDEYHSVCKSLRATENVKDDIKDRKRKLEAVDKETKGAATSASVDLDSAPTFTQTPLVMRRAAAGG